MEGLNRRALPSTRQRQWSGVDTEDDNFEEGSLLRPLFRRSERGGDDVNVTASATERRSEPAPPKTACDFFVQSVREVYKKHSPDALPSDLERGLAGRWNSIAGKAREGYEKMAMDDRARYARQMEEWKEARAKRDGRSRQREGCAQIVELKGRTVPRDRLHSARRRRLPTRNWVEDEESNVARTEGGQNVVHVKDPLGLRPKRLDLAVVAADCPNLEAEYISLDVTSTLEEVLQTLHDTSRSTWATGWLQDGSGVDELELLGLVVGRRQSSTMAELPAGQGREPDGEKLLKSPPQIQLNRRNASADSLLQGMENFQDENEEGSALDAGEPNAVTDRSKEETMSQGREGRELGHDVNFTHDEEDDDDDEQTENTKGDTVNNPRKNTADGGECENEGSAAEKKVGDIARGSSKRGGASQWDAEGPSRKKRKTPKRLPKRSFDEKVEELKKWKEIHGHCDVPQKDGALGAWVKRVRMSYKYLKAGKQTESSPSWCRELTSYEQVDKLTALGFRFVLREQKVRETFEDRLQHYIRQKEEAGATGKIEDKKLRHWMGHMRRQYNRFQKGKPSEINQERIDAMNQAGFVWNVREDSFENKLEELKAFSDKFGHSRVTLELDKTLYMFVKHQQQCYSMLKQGKPTSLTWERIQRLMDVGIDFECCKAERRATSAEDRHETIMKAFRKFRDENGHCNIAQTHPTLGQFVAKLRVKYRLLQQGKPCNLTEQHIKDLEEIGFPFDGDRNLLFRFQQKFDEKVRLLMRHKEDTGDFEGHPTLSKWLNGMRKKYRECKDGKRILSSWSEDQFKKLADIGVDLEVEPESRSVKTFEERLKELSQYKEVHGHCDVRYNALVTGSKNLSRWILRVREKYANWRDGKPTTLTTEQVEQLYSLGLNLEKE